jgi:hypothetical protein
MGNFSAPGDDKIPKGATKVSIRPAPGPNLGSFEMVGKPAAAGAQAVPQAAQVPMQISEPQVPKGAQPVPLAPSPQLAATAIPPQQIQGPALPQRSSFMAAPQRALAQATQPQQRRFATDVHRIEVVAEGPDGKEYLAAYEVEVPAGSKLLGVRSSINPTT